MRPSASMDRRTRNLLLFCVILLAALSIHRLHCAEPPAIPAELRGQTMGTTWSVKLAAGNAPGSEEKWEVAASIQSELDRIEGLMSTYDPESEISRFNRHPAEHPFSASPETLEVLAVAEEVSELSQGAFDVTVGPLVAAWGFGSNAEPTPPPAPESEELLGLSERVGYEKLVLHEGEGALTRSHPGLEVDLSAIAKGYAVDRVVELLEGLGYTDLLVEVGGELGARGRKTPERAWRVAVERPDSDARRVHQAISLEDGALATSGDYRNYYERDGVRTSHTIDPRTRRPIAHRLASVSVLHREAVWADALATALNVLGPEQGLQLAEREGLAAYFLIRSDDGEFRPLATRSFQSLIDAEAEAAP